MDLIVDVPKTKPHTKKKHVDAVAGISAKKVSKKGDQAKKHFPLGVMAGDAELEREGEGLSAKQSRAVLWTKYTGKEKQLTVRIRQLKPEPKDKDKGLLPDKTVEVKDPFVHYDAKDLKPGTKYEYRFLEKAGKAEGHSAIGRFWTPIARDSYDEVVFGGTSCTFQYEANGRKKLTNRNLSHAARHNGDMRFFIHLGDHVYCDALKSNPAATLGQFRTKYKVGYTRPGLKALHKAFGMYNTWDDHEVFNNWIGNKDTRLSILPAKLRRKVRKKGGLTVSSVMKTGVRSFYDHHPIRKKNRTKKKLWRRFRWGKTLELFILDCRNERSLEDGLYISKAQEKWLVDGINQSKAVFKFILSSRPIGYLPHKPPDTKKRPKDDYRWADPCVREQRDRILKHTEKTQGVCWLSGDVHFGTTGFADPPEAGKIKVGEVLMGPGGQWVGKPGTEKWNDKSKKGGLIDKLNKKPARFPFATLHSNYVVIRATANEKDVESSRLKISYYGGNKKPARLLHSETRSYAGEVLTWSTTKLRGQTWHPPNGAQANATP